MNATLAYRPRQSAAPNSENSCLSSDEPILFEAFPWRLRSGLECPQRAPRIAFRNSEIFGLPSGRRIHQMLQGPGPPGSEKLREFLPLQVLRCGASGLQNSLLPRLAKTVLASLQVLQ